MNTGAPPLAHIMDAAGTEITPKISGGRLEGLLEVYNSLLPSHRGDACHVGDLNRLAAAQADRVNEILMSGQISDGPPPAPGIPLFTYDASSPTLAAQSLAVNPAISAAQLAATDPGPPYMSNGNPLRLAVFADTAESFDDLSFMES